MLEPPANSTGSRNCLALSELRILAVFRQSAYHCSIGPLAKPPGGSATGFVSGFQPFRAVKMNEMNEREGPAQEQEKVDDDEGIVLLPLVAPLAALSSSFVVGVSGEPLKTVATPVGGHGCIHVELVGRPGWTASGAWSDDGRELLLVDTRSRQLLRYTSDGQMLGARGSMADAPVVDRSPLMIERNGGAHDGELRSLRAHLGALSIRLSAAYVRGSNPGQHVEAGLRNNIAIGHICEASEATGRILLNPLCRASTGHKGRARGRPKE